MPPCFAVIPLVSLPSLCVMSKRRTPPQGMIIVSFSPRKRNRSFPTRDRCHHFITAVWSVFSFIVLFLSHQQHVGKSVRCVVMLRHVGHVASFIPPHSLFMFITSSFVASQAYTKTRSILLYVLCGPCISCVLCFLFCTLCKHYPTKKVTHHSPLLLLFVLSLTYYHIVQQPPFKHQTHM